MDDLKKHAQSQNGKCLSVQYNGYHQQHKWQCKKTHIWNATWANINSGKWCPDCLYKSEAKFREVIEEVLCAKFPKKKPKWLTNEKGNRLELDGYNKILKIAFEYQGIQHFQKVSYFGDTKKRFIKRQKHDLIKKSLCKKMNIILLCPTYELEEGDYEEFILSNISNINELV